MVRNAAHVPELHRHPSACGMNRAGHGLPAVFLRVGVDAGGERIALTLAADLCGLGDDQPCARALHVVARIHLAGNIAGLARARPGQRRHDDAVGQVERSDFQGGEQREQSGLCHGVSLELRVM
ncbi:hypothetical protein GALL_474430 [mine drainage metagenome]|uniref:Uncharacterized protein n=1 Tax=mine drainage metagenome TaxID=410659 RepID=A0A1J5PT87_9ZZZZ